MEIHPVGTLKKGDPCVVVFTDGRNPWLCRIASTLTQIENLHSMYECITPYGSVVVAGAAWCRSPTDEELQRLLSMEQAAKEKGVPLYKGRIRSSEEE